MASCINKSILVGNLGNDPETKYTQGGMAITKISLATTSVRKDHDGNSQENTQWHRVTFFGKLGEIAGEYLRKGSRSEEHTSELQSLMSITYAVFCFKKTQHKIEKQ